MKLFVTALAVLAALLAAACSAGGSSNEAIPSPPGGASEEFAQSAEAGGIEVEATWLTAQENEEEADLSAYPLDSFILIRIGFTTHAGDLSSIDMESAARLRQTGGEMAPEKWVSINDDSHHRAGVLVFPRQLRDGPVELLLNLGEDELTMAWDSAPGA